MLKVRAVFFDVGEVLVDETTEYGTWADWLGVPRHTFSAMFGAVIARGDDYRQTFHHLRPGFDLAGERLRLKAAYFGEHFDESDLYPQRRRRAAPLPVGEVPGQRRLAGLGRARAQPAALDGHHRTRRLRAAGRQGPPPPHS